jgi:hypothetical protein
LLQTTALKSLSKAAHRHHRGVDDSNLLGAMSYSGRAFRLGAEVLLAEALFVVPQFEFAYLDPRRDSFRHGVMGAIRRTINLIIALVLFAMGCWGACLFLLHCSHPERRHLCNE